MIVYPVYHEYTTEEDFEYGPRWNCDLVKLFDTLEKAQEFGGSKPWFENNHYTYGGGIEVE